MPTPNASARSSAAVACFITSRRNPSVIGIISVMQTRPTYPVFAHWLHPFACQSVMSPSPST
jgi:hypothetical protein